MNEKSKAGWVLALTSTASLMVTLDLLVVATALSTIRRDLDASLEHLEWTVNAYSLSFAVLLMTAATFGDRWGAGESSRWGSCCSRWPRSGVRWRPTWTR